MEISNKQLDKMHDWVKNTMQEEKFYPIKTDEARNCLVELYQENSCPELEFKTDETGKAISVKKIDYEFLMK